MDLRILDSRLILGVERKENGMDTRVDEALAITRSLIQLEEEARSIQAKITEARDELARLLGNDVTPPKKRKPTSIQHIPAPEPSHPDLPPGDYGSRGGYGQRGKTGEILDYMRTIPNQTVSPEEIVRALKWEGDKEVNGQIASRMLQRLAQTGKLAKPYRGVYKLIVEEEKKED